jgi:tripartite-type tricarboxylate transporter receptor subunit TctC
MKLPRRTFLHLAAGAAALIALTSTTLAQDWPTRPITMLVTVAAGGGSDVLARILAPRLSELLGRQVIVDNDGRAGGMPGVSRVAKAAPDGYLFVLGNVGTFAANQTLYKNPLYNAATDFAPVTLFSEQPNVLVARKDLPVGNLPEFIAYAKVKQAKMQYGSPGTGSSGHLACLLLNGALGITVTHVPYRSGAQAMQDLLAGRIDYSCNFIVTARPQIDGGTVKGLAAMTRERTPLLAHLASAHEQGLTNFDTSSWNAFFLPKGTPPAIIRKLHDATVATMETPAVQERLKEIGVTVVGPERRSPEYLTKFVVSEIEKWAGPIKASGVSMD